MPPRSPGHGSTALLRLGLHTILLLAAAALSLFASGAHGSVAPAASIPSRPPGVYITATFSVAHDLDLAASFLDHYLGAGLRPSSFLISVHVPRFEDVALAGLTRSQVDRRFEIIKQIMLDRNIAIANIWHENHSGHTNLVQRMEVLRNNTVWDDWIILADSDEFHEYPGHIPKYLNSLGSRGKNLVYGRFKDRVARDCRLHDALPSPSIWEQFPCNVSLTKRVVKGETRKVMAHKGYFRAFSGNHALFRPQQKSEPVWAPFFPRGMPNPKPVSPNKEFVIYHFKWRTNVREKLEARVQKYKAAGASTWIESARILQHLNHTRGRLDLAGCPC